MSTCSIRRIMGALQPPAYHGIATVALDHRRVRAAIDDLAARNAVARWYRMRRSAASTMSASTPAAGRTAATLMDASCPARAIGVMLIIIAATMPNAVRIPSDPLERYPDLTIPALEGATRMHRKLTAELLERHSTCSVSTMPAPARHRRGVGASGKARDIVWIAHELTHHSRRFLLHGMIDAIINQTGHEFAPRRGSARALLGRADRSRSGAYPHRPLSPGQSAVAIDGFRLNHVTRRPDRRIHNVIEPTLFEARLR